MLLLRAASLGFFLTHWEIQTRSTWQSRCVLRGCVGVGVMRHAYHLAQILRAQATRSQVQWSASQRAHREHAPDDVVGKVPRAKLQRVSSEDCRTPFRGQAVKQSTEMRPVLDFFATAHSFCGRSLQSVQLNGVFLSFLQSSCWPWRPESVRTLRSKPSISRRQLATLSRT